MISGDIFPARLALAKMRLLRYLESIAPTDFH